MGSMLLATKCCFASGDVEIKQNILTLSLAKNEINAEATLKTYGLFIYEDVRSVISVISVINNWFCENVLA